MALNDDWLADVRRWYFDERDRNDGTPAQGVASDLAEAPDDPIGYESAWPGPAASPGIDAPGAARAELR